jgi:hypothetical protein
MKRSLLMASMIVVAAATALAQQPIKAKTETGKDVILNADGTWKYAELVTAPRVLVEVTKPGSAKKLFKSDRAKFGIWYDETKWHLSSKATEPGRTEFDLLRGDGYATAIIEEIGIPLNSLKRIALDNAKQAAADAKIIFEEYRTVNGRQVLCLKIEGTIEEIPFRFYGYYYGGKEGTIQLLTFTGTSLFEKYESDFTSLLNGLEIY